MTENEAMKKGKVMPISSLFSPEEAYKASKRVQEAIAEYQKELDRQKGFMNENTDLINVVQKLPEELHHEIMVPFGNAAFFPGRLIHTNEFMVLLGEDLYVERTSKQTIDILKRRSKVVEDKIESLKAVMQDLKAEASFFDATASEAADGLVEIREDYVEESPSEVVTLTKNPKSDSHNFLEAENSKAAVEDEEYSRILSRIDELELEEEEAEKANESSEDEQMENNRGCSTSFTENEVRSSECMMQVEAAKLKSVLKDGSSHGKGPVPGDLTSRKVTFDLPEVKEKVQPPNVDDHGVSHAPAIPGSYGNKAFTNSIVKHTQNIGMKEKVQPPVAEDHEVSRPSAIPGSYGNMAFTGSIVERSQNTGMNSADDQQTSTRTSKRVSRFLMQRK